MRKNHGQHNRFHFRTSIARTSVCGPARESDTKNNDLPFGHRLDLLHIPKIDRSRPPLTVADATDYETPSASTGRFAASHAVMPPAISLTSAKP